MAWLDENDMYGDKEIEEGQYKCPSCGDSMKEDVELCDTCEFMYDKECNKD
jgi:uncharacterized protein (UPF0212 family)